MRHSMEVRAKAAEFFDLGFAERTVSRLLNVHEGTVVNWLYTYRALGKEALFVTKRRIYDHETKVAAAKAVVDDGMSKPEAMGAFGIRSKTRLDVWCRLYREGGSEALLPKPKGRPKRTEPVFSSPEEELRARIRELELENEILKRFNALAEDIERKQRIR